MSLDWRRKLEYPGETPEACGEHAEANAPPLPRVNFMNIKHIQH